jgi:hypothetical protein
MEFKSLPEVKALVEKKKMLALFMGATCDQAYSENNDYKQDGLLFYFSKEVHCPSKVYRNLSSASLEYNSSWDWLVPVHAKLMELAQEDDDLNNYLGDGFKSEFGENYVSGWLDANSLNQPINAFELVTNAVEWYNKKEGRKNLVSL